MDCESVSPFGADFLTLAIRDVERMNRVSVLEVCVSAFEYTCSFSKSGIGERESQLVSKNAKLDTAAAKVESTKRCLRSTKQGGSLT